MAGVRPAGRRCRDACRGRLGRGVTGGLWADEAELLAGRVLAELGIPRLSPEQVEPVECRELALDVISGELAPEPYSTTSRMWSGSPSGKHWACCVWPLGQFWRREDLDAWRAMAVRDPAGVEDEVLGYAREFVRIAEERLRTWLP